MLHYTAIGLDNVWLENGYTTKATRYGQAVAVNDADKLHALVAVTVARKTGKLTRKEFRFLRTMLLLSQKSFGETVGVSEQAVSLWERYGKVPMAAELVLRLLVLDSLDGRGVLKDLIHRINTVDRLVNQKVVARARSHEWTAKFKDADVVAVKAVDEACEA